MRERLYRSRSDRMLFGVAGGMAKSLDLDPSVVRLVWALLVLAGGVGLLLYIVAAIVIPEEPLGGAAGAASGDSAGAAGPGTSSSGSQPRASRPRGNAPVIIGLALVAVGVWLLVRRFLPTIDSDLIWPALLVLVGIVLVVGSLRGSRGRD